MRRVWVAVAMLVGLSAWLGPASSGPSGVAAAAHGYGSIVTALVQREDQATLEGDRRALAAVFLPGSPMAAALQAKAERRLAYLRDWAQARAIQFVRVRVSVDIASVTPEGPDQVRLAAADQAQYFYRHRVGNTTLSWFGLGVYHRYTLQRVDGRWYIADDVFIDPLNQDTRLAGAAHPAIIRVPPSARPPGPLAAGARRAIAYAASYCGAAPGCGHNHRYNPLYADYNWQGGDCTNFISQVLRAGGFSETSTWAWDAARHEGTAAWVNAPALVEYLERTGRVTVLAQGTMPHLLDSAPGARAPVSRLRPGDLIAYIERGRVVHMAIVVGYDVDGYPLVISHSADRYREPWDLGWDRTTRFLFLQVHYPPAAG